MVKDKEDYRREEPVTSEGSGEQSSQMDDVAYKTGWKRALASALSIAVAVEWNKSRAFIRGLEKNGSDSLLWMYYHDWNTAHEIAGDIACAASGRSELQSEEVESKAKDSER